MHSVQLFLPDFTLLFPISALTISNIQPDFTGDWECRVRTSRGNTTRTVHIVVLETSAKYCGAERVANNKGEFKLVHKIWLTSTCGLKNFLLDWMLASLGVMKELWSHLDPIISHFQLFNWLKMAFWGFFRN